MATLDKNIQILMLKGEKGDPGEMGGSTWGEIVGTIDNQTDLITRLSGKASVSHSHTMSDITDLPVYASGTWNPQILFWNGSYDGHYNIIYANYYKIGNMVYIQCAVKFTDKPSTGHQIEVNNIPFTSVGMSVGTYELNDNFDLQGATIASGVFRIPNNVGYGTLAGMSSDNIDNDRYLVISATYMTS